MNSAFFGRIVAGLLLALVGLSALAQGYPNKPVKLQVPFESGGSNDLIARLLAPALGNALGQPVNVENRPGNGGVVGANDTAKSAPDGYSLGMATVSTTASNPALNPKIPYNVATDFTPIVNIALAPNVIGVHPGFPAKDYKSFVAEIKKSPGKYTYATSGTGAIGHVQMELYKSLTATMINHNPYRGAGPALVQTAAGQTQIVFDSLPSMQSFIQSKQLIPILVAAPQRLPTLPDVPTFAEVGLEPLNRMAYFGIYGPKGLPKEVVEKINASVRKALEDPMVKKRLQDLGASVSAGTADQLGNQMKAELEFYKKMVAQTNLKLDN
ncbi:MAG: tripartite tricarboxylate transporter substrate-binding protein [Burkholderiales bacterium]